MAASEVTIEMPGRVNGCRNGRFDSVSGVPQGEESAIDLPTFQQMPDEPVAAELTEELPARDQQTAGAAAKPKPAEESTAKNTHRSVAGSTTKAAKNTSRSRPRVKYQPQAAFDKELAKLEVLSQSALAGNTTALDELRAALDGSPHIWRRIADLQYLVELKLIRLVAGQDPLRNEAFRKRASELRHHLLDGEPSSLAVKMSASRAIACFMFAQFLELRALEMPNDLRCIKQLEQAERRFGVAMRTFALARQADAQLQRLAQHNSQGL